VGGSLEKLWPIWSSGFYRLTCYDNLTRELRMLARFKKLELVNEAT